MGQPLSLEISKGGDTLAIPAERVVAVDSFDLEHTAIAGWQIRLAPASTAITDAVRAKQGGTVDIFVGTDAILRGGRLLRTPRQGDELTLVGRGPGEQLRDDTTVETYSDLPVYQAIDDYTGNTPATTWTVQKPSVRLVDDDETKIDAPASDDFTDHFDPDDDHPIVVSSNTVELAQCGFFREAENGDISNGSTVTAGDNSTFSNKEAVDLSLTGAKVEFDFNVDYRIPEEDVRALALYRYNNWTGTFIWRLNGTKVREYDQSDVDTENQWQNGFTDFNVSQDLEGSNSVTFEITDVTDGQIELDAIAVWDEGERFRQSGFGINVDNSVENNAVSQPEEYPDFWDISTSIDSVWHIQAATTTISIDGLGTSDRIAMSTDGSTYVTDTDVSSLDVDFDAEVIWGDSLDVEIRLARYDDDAMTSPTTGDAGQVIDDLEIKLTTDDLPIITGSRTLDAETWYENIQALHEDGDMRYTVNFDATNLTVESYRTGDDSLIKPDDWTTDGRDAVQDERDTERYFNKVNVHAPDGGFATFSISLQDEIDRFGETVETGYVADANNKTDAEIEARRELRTGVGRDEFRGTTAIVPTLVEPGYPYEPAEFDGTKANLEQTSLGWDGDGVTGSLSFGSRRSVVAVIQERTA
jgi:hypothetical protein